MRLVVRVRRDHHGLRPRVELESPANIPSWGINSQLDCDVTDPVLQAFFAAPLDQADTYAAGRRLFAALSANPGVNNGLSQLVLASDGEVVLDLLGDEVEAMPWECLYVEGAQPCFVALESWPVSRIVRDVQREGDADFDVDLSSGLRVAAVLGAHGWSALPEWHALRDAVLSPDAPVQLRLFAADGQVLNEARAHAANDSRVEVQPIPRDQKAELIDAVNAADPHVLHFFCHGEASPDPYLRISDVVDVETNNPGSLYLYPSDVEDMAGERPLLALLGCCKGARPGATSRSMGRKLVQKRFHAAVGMSDSMDFADLSKFSSSFYRQLAGALMQPESLQAFAWTKLMLAPRRALVPDPHPQHAPKNKRWVAPVLFERGHELRFQLFDADRDRLDAIRKLEESLPLLTPELRAMVESQLARLRGGQ